MPTIAEIATELARRSRERDAGGGTSGGQTTPPVSSIPSPAPVPSQTTAPTLPQPTAPFVQEQYLTSLSSQQDQARKQLEDNYRQRKAEIDRELETLNIKQQGILAKSDPRTRETFGQETNIVQNQLDAAESASKTLQTNYDERQRLVNELEGLLTQGNVAIEQQRKAPVSQRVLSGRVDNTVRDVAARTGVINSVLAARQGQISIAHDLIDQSRSAVESQWNDQLSYYNALLNYNEKNVIRLDKESKDIAEKQTALLEKDLSNIEETTDYLKKLMTDPETAQFIADAGVKITDSVEQINSKLAAQARVKDIAKFQNELVAKGYTRLPYPSGSADAVFEIDGQKLYFKRPPEKKKEDKAESPLGILDIQRYQELYPDAGVVAGDTGMEANAKVARSNSPEGRLRATISGFQSEGITYEDVVSNIETSTTITDKETAKLIAQEVYGVAGETASDEPIEQEIADIRTRYTSNPNLPKSVNVDNEIKSILKKRGYTNQQIIDSSLGSGVDRFITGISRFLFGS